MLFNHVALVGVGLLGGSMGLALQRQSLARKVVAYVRRAASADEAIQLKVAHQATLDLAEAVAESDLVVLCTPIAQMRSLSESLLPALRPGTLITDVGSVKASVVQELEPLFAQRGCHFVGSHPMAGGEKIGMAHARGDLFDESVCVITPTARSPKPCVQALRSLWEGLGSTILEMSPEKHDELVCRSSHLPHLIAAELALQVLNPLHPPEQPRLCAGGFRDTTRIASGSPEMWKDICLANQKNLSRDINAFVESLKKFQKVLESNDPMAVEAYFRQAKELRDAWQQGQRGRAAE